MVLLVVSLYATPIQASDHCYQWYGQTACFPTVETYFKIPPPVTSGVAVYYQPGAMEATAQYRGFPLNPQPPYIGYVAAETPAMIGWTVWLKRQRNDWEGPYLVVDCPIRGYQYGQVVLWGQVVEVDFFTAVRWGMVNQTGYDEQRHYSYDVVMPGLPGVEVSYLPPSDDLPSSVSYSDWYTGIFVSGPRNEYIWEDVPNNPTRWCITREQTCDGAWRYFCQPKPPIQDELRYGLWKQEGGE